MTATRHPGHLPRILVTRSEPGAQETARRLVVRGYDPVIEPALALHRLQAAIPPFDALAFTSANGVRIFSSLSPRRDVPVLCVGARTAEAAREAGYADVRSANGNVATLTDMALQRLSADSRLLHAGNEDARGDLAGALKRAGRKADFVAIYRAEPAGAPGPGLAAHLAGRETLDAALIHSPAAGAVLGGFLTMATGAPPLPLAAISEAALPPSRGARVEVAEAPNEAALLDALDLLFGRA